MSAAWCGAGYTPARGITALDAIAEKPVVASVIDRNMPAPSRFVAEIQCALDVVVAVRIDRRVKAAVRGTFSARARDAIEAIHQMNADILNGIARIKCARQPVVTTIEPGALAPCVEIAVFDTVTYDAVVARIVIGCMFALLFFRVARIKRAIEFVAAIVHR